MLLSSPAPSSPNLIFLLTPYHWHPPKPWLIRLFFFHFFCIYYISMQFYINEIISYKLGFLCVLFAPSPLTPRHINILIWVFLFLSHVHLILPKYTHPHRGRHFRSLPTCSSVPSLWHSLSPSPSSAFIPISHIPLLLLCLLPGLSSVSQGCPGSSLTPIQPSGLTKMLIV